MARKLLTAVLSDSELKKLRAKPFVERNKIIQDRLNAHQKVRVQKIREKSKKVRKDFAF